METKPKKYRKKPVVIEAPEKHGGASLKTWIEESLDPYVS